MENHSLWTLLVLLIALSCQEGSQASGSTQAPQPVVVGADQVESLSLFAGAGSNAQRRLGLLTHSPAQTSDGKSTLSTLLDAGWQVTVVFTPEHGFEANREGWIEASDESPEDALEASTSAPIYEFKSLYGANKAPLLEDLIDLDLLVVDLVDVGARFYTYSSTLGLCMEVCAQVDLPVLILDRPNPMGGLKVAGPVRDNDAASFTAWHSLPVLHGLTLGELAQLYNAERDWHLDLRVLPVQAWKRPQEFPSTQQTWRSPSPNLPDFSAARCYSGTALLEFTNVSVGRGTEAPFRWIGAPWMTDHQDWVDWLNGQELPGVWFEPISFTPTRATHAGELCHGVALQVSHPDLFQPVSTGVALAAGLVALGNPNWDDSKLGKLLAHEATCSAIRAGSDWHQIVASWRADEDSFRQRRQAHLLYQD